MSMVDDEYDDYGDRYDEWRHHKHHDYGHHKHHDYGHHKHHDHGHHHRDHGHHDHGHHVHETRRAYGERAKHREHAGSPDKYGGKMTKDDKRLNDEIEMLKNKLKKLEQNMQ